LSNFQVLFSVSLLNIHHGLASKRAATGRREAKASERAGREAGAMEKPQKPTTRKQTYA
jgi:hypothetical protein